MKRPILRFLVLVCLAHLPGRTVAGEYRKLTFLVYKGSEQVGTLHVSELVELSRTTYTLTSDVNIDLIIEFNIEETIKDIFENGRLLSSVHTRYVNETLRANNTANHIDGKYKLVDVDASVKYLKEKIEVTVLSLYFQEPRPDQLVYSENFQQMVKLRQEGNHTYSIALPNGNTTTYRYREGKMQSVTSQTRFGEIKFVSQND